MDRCAMNQIQQKVDFFIELRTFIMNRDGPDSILSVLFDNEQNLRWVRRECYERDYGEEIVKLFFDMTCVEGTYYNVAFGIIINDVPAVRRIVG